MKDIDWELIFSVGLTISDLGDVNHEFKSDADCVKEQIMAIMNRWAEMPMEAKI